MTGSLNGIRVSQQAEEEQAEAEDEGEYQRAPDGAFLRQQMHEERAYETYFKGQL
jgi:hypothetical protein